MESAIKIDSISIDLASSISKSADAEKCEHFSMRGFVSEVRKKDWKLCWPFPLKDKEGDSMEQLSFLPPLDVTKSRCWSCQNGPQETSSMGTPYKDDKTDLNCCSAGGRSDSNYSNAALGLDIQQPQMPDTSKGKEIDLNNCACLNSGEYCPPNNKETEKKTEVAGNTKIGHGLRMEVGSSNPITSVPPEADLGLRLEEHANDTEFGGNEVADVELPTSNNPECIGKSFAEHFREQTPISVDDQCPQELRKASPASEEGTVVTGADNTTDHRTEYHMEPVAHHSTVPRRMDNLVENEFQDHQFVIPGGLPRRKAPKVRLLTDIIIEDEEIQKAKKTAEQGTSSNDTSNAPAALPTQSVNHNKENACGEVTKMHRNKKRKSPRDKDWKPKATLSKKAKNEVRKLKGDAEATKAVPNTGSKNELAGIDLQDGVKKYGSEPKIERRHTKIKKNKKIQGGDISLTSEPHQGKMQIENQEDRDGVDKVWVSETPSRLATPAVSEKEIDTLPLLAQTENDSRYKGKGKMQQVDGELASLPCQKSGMLTKGSFGNTDAKIRSNMSAGISVHLAQSEFIEKEREEGLHFSLNSYLAAQAFGKKCAHQIENQIPISVPSPEETSNAHQLKWKGRETNAVGEPSILSKDRMDGNSAKGVHCGASSDVYPHGMPFPDNKHKQISQVEAGSHFYDQTKKVSRACNAAKTPEFQEVVSTVERYGDQNTNKVPEQGIDDIPMDIVELMAKNQYERCLPDAENRNCVPEKSIIRRKAPVTVGTAVYGKGELRLQQEGPVDKRHEPYGQNSVFKTRVTVEPSQRNSVDYFSPFGGSCLNRNGLYGPPYPLAVEVPQNQKKPGRIHISSMDSGLLGSAQTAQLNGCTAEHRSSDAISQALAGGCSLHRNILQQDDEASRIWASVTPNRASSEYDLPTKVASQSTSADMDVISHRHGAENKQKRKRDFDLNAEYTFPCKHNKTELHQNARGSLDLYSNETISAMHLLSLMDAGMQSARRPFSPGVNTELVKGPFYSRDCNDNYDIGTSKDAASSKGPLADHYSKSHFADKSDALFVPSVTFGASSSGIKHDNQNFVRAADLTTQIFFKPGSKDKVWNFNSPLLVEGGKSPKSILDQDASQKRLTGMSDFKLFGQTLFENETSTPRKLETRGTSGTLLPVENNSQSNVCSLNRNPADFTTPSTGNPYMIRGEDLMFEEPSISKVRSDLLILEGCKQRRNLKQTKLKERVKH